MWQAKSTGSELQRRIVDKSEHERCVSECHVKQPFRLPNMRCKELCLFHFIKTQEDILALYPKFNIQHCHKYRALLSKHSGKGISKYSFS